MHTAPPAAAWAAWAEWICNSAIAGGSPPAVPYCSFRRAGFGPLFFVRPAGRTLLEVEVLYIPDTGKC